MLGKLATMPGEVHGHIFFVGREPSGRPSAAHLGPSRGGQAATSPVAPGQCGREWRRERQERVAGHSPAVRYVHAAGGKIQLELLPGASHNFVNMPSANTDRALSVMKVFIGQQLARN
jgi:hypothetical protein